MIENFSNKNEVQQVEDNFITSSNLITTHSCEHGLEYKNVSKKLLQWTVKGSMTERIAFCLKETT